MPQGGLAHRPQQHVPTWQEEERATVITRPVAILSLQCSVERHPVESPLTGCVGSRQVLKVTPLQRRKRSGELSGLQLGQRRPWHLETKSK